MPASEPKPTKTSGPQRVMERLGLRRPIDLALHLPLRYEDETRLTRLSEARPGEVVQVEGVVTQCRVETARRREGLDTAPTTLAGVRQMIKALRAGRAVGLLPDQVPPEGQGLWSPFFGQPAYTMTLAARLIQQTGAVPLLVWGERRPRGQGYDLHFRALAEPLADELAPAVAQINREMERLIRECPTQYLWGYGRYKQPREQPA